MVPLLLLNFSCIIYLKFFTCTLAFGEGTHFGSDTASGSFLNKSGNSIFLFSVGENNVAGNDGGGARTYKKMTVYFEKIVTFSSSSLGNILVSS